MGAAVHVPILAVAAILAGCWQPQYFAPRELQTTQGPDGDTAALYSIAPAQDSEVRGDLRVWSSGATAAYDGDLEVVQLFVGFELANHGVRPLAIDPDSIVCDNLELHSGPQQALRPHGIRGDLAAAPGTMARADVQFRPPAGTPRDIRGFALRFVVRSDDRDVLRQVTPFIGIGSRRYDPWFDGPYFYGGWGWGYGGWGWGYGAWGPYGPYGPWGPWGPWRPGLGWYWGPGFCW